MNPLPVKSLDERVSRLAVNTIKMLAVDAVEKANSGHPGMPMGAADYAFHLWYYFLQTSPKSPLWPNRDRFVLSAGHGSMLLYSLLHLFGFGLSIDDLKRFRQWESLTPGHPEYGRTPGVETTTGPLGQGFANAVGMAIASKMMATRFNTPDFSPIDHHVYAIVSDGDMMEGVTHEAASLAGHLRLSNLIFLYDDNGITIDGKTDLTFSENVAQRFEAYGWHTQTIDGHNSNQILEAIGAAKNELSRPSLIVARTHIAHGAPTKHDTSGSHGAPLGKEEVAATKKALGWPSEPFHVPDEVCSHVAKRVEELEAMRAGWEKQLKEWRKRHPDLSRQWDAHWNREVPIDLLDILGKELPAMPEATRSISGKLEQTIAAHVPALVGGAADLEESTKTRIQGSPSVTSGNFTGRNICFGIREHAMGSIANGLALYGSFIPLTSTFFVFSDYMRPAIRLAALSKLQSIYVFTHDTIFVGEDGPTHQPVEHLAALRIIPNLAVVRPADSLECAAAWKIALSRQEGPTAIILTRQKLPAIDRTSHVAPEDLLRGVYVAAEAPNNKPDLILAASGSELHLAMGARKLLAAKGVNTRVVSALCLETFAKQRYSYRDRIFPPSKIPFAVIEAGRMDLWPRWVGRDALLIGVDRFGESAPWEVLAEKFGFTIPAVTAKIEAWLTKRRDRM